MIVRWVRDEKRGSGGGAQIWDDGHSFSKRSTGPSPCQPLALLQAGMKDQIRWGESEVM